MSEDRLKELKRQRDLLLEHLDWLNKEIDQASLTHFPSPAPKSDRLLETFSQDRPIEQSLSNRNPPQDHEDTEPNVVADLYTELGPDVASARADTRKGCLLMAGFAFSTLAAFFGYIFFFYGD